MACDARWLANGCARARDGRVVPAVRPDHCIKAEQAPGAAALTRTRPITPVGLPHPQQALGSADLGDTLDVAIDAHPCITLFAKEGGVSIRLPGTRAGIGIKFDTLYLWAAKRWQCEAWSAVLR